MPRTEHSGPEKMGASLAASSFLHGDHQNRWPTFVGILAVVVIPIET
jgi:hypothetical protein